MKKLVILLALLGISSGTTPGGTAPEGPSAPSLPASPACKDAAQVYSSPAARRHQMGQVRHWRALMMHQH